MSTSLSCGAGAAQAVSKANNKPATVRERIRGIVGIRGVSAAVNLKHREQELCQISTEGDIAGYGIKVALNILKPGFSPFHI